MRLLLVTYVAHGIDWVVHCYEQSFYTLFFLKIQLAKGYLLLGGKGDDTVCA